MVPIKSSYIYQFVHRHTDTQTHRHTHTQPHTHTHTHTHTDNQWHMDIVTPPAQTWRMTDILGKKGKNRFTAISLYLDKVFVLNPGDVRFGVPQRHAGQHCLAVDQHRDIVWMSLSLTITVLSSPLWCQCG